MRAPPRLGSKDRRLAFPLAAATVAIAALIRDNIGLLFMALMVMPAPRGPVARTVLPKKEVSLRGYNVT